MLLCHIRPEFVSSNSIYTSEFTKLSLRMLSIGNELERALCSMYLSQTRKLTFLLGFQNLQITDSWWSGEFKRFRWNYLSNYNAFCLIKWSKSKVLHNLLSSSTTHFNYIRYPSLLLELLFPVVIMHKIKKHTLFQEAVWDSVTLSNHFDLKIHDVGNSYFQKKKYSRKAVGLPISHGSSELSSVLQYCLRLRSPVAHITLTTPYPR